ncbi:hypothetical protein S7711_00844 [Stachybotrys chartarum IBT 7711]|uniref:Uncharacterized protein n=1 Tax=Stachybotrys chartarum (strain CBS 109288 / IBT 7711) TaxID=1280523 RepID=A0A084B0E0_STACB|nr:hypothetical protein S7711_00844 [Stachybotrys chartarum IBT 7711]KFA46988.1 hypothetical protein S40293_08991 [Stachybotrys chartarum IBT 40293]KFA78174.1 hypothetical protein S40288_01398 [Stachybotrys chartarum IBT 40288]
MRRSSPRQLGSVCQSCTLVPIRTATLPPFARPLLSSSRASVSRVQHVRPTGLRLIQTAAVESEAPTDTSVPAQSLRQPPNPAQLARVVEETRNRFLSEDGLHSKKSTLDALQSCMQAATTIHPLLKRATAQSKASASRLATLGAERAGLKLPIDTNMVDAINRISYSAYAIITDPNVELDSEILAAYVHIQSQLGRPESLPSVIELFAKKAKPVLKDGQISYVPQNPNSPTKAVDIPVAELALRTAIEAKNLDAALGIVEAAYCVPAFKRQKLLKHASVPAMALAALPFGIFGMASGYAAYWQNTMDMYTATGIGFAGISGYFFVVGSLGMIAKLSHKDQMKRVTWTPGTPLRYRWLREEERAALDKVACAWGFKEPWRHGEETGAEWEGLKEYMGYRQMLLDRVEFMQGMS